MIPECVALGIMSGGQWHYLPNKRTAYGTVAGISAFAKNPFLTDFFAVK